MANNSTRIEQLWDKLASVDGFFYRSEPGEKSTMGWAGIGTGIVQLERKFGQLHFVEQGEFQPVAGVNLDIKNRYIWQKTAQGIALYYQRREQPVFIFELVWNEIQQRWCNQQEHACRDDAYSAQLWENAQGFTLNWRITGPHKDERLCYQYFNTAIQQKYTCQAH